MINWVSIICYQFYYLAHILMQNDNYLLDCEFNFLYKKVNIELIVLLLINIFINIQYRFHK